MTTTTSRLIPVTDHKGTMLLPEDDRAEPNPGSVVLTDGLHGTAWQKHFVADQRWHSTGSGKSKTWEQLLRQRNLVLVYDAAIREGDHR